METKSKRTGRFGLAPHFLFAVGMVAAWGAGPIGLAALGLWSAPANLLHVGVLIAAVVGADAWRRSDRRLGAFLLVQPLALLVWWVPRLEPERPGADEAPDLTLAVWNLGASVAPPERAAQWIEASGADVVALCELGEAVAEELEATLAERYPHRALYPLGVPGRGLLSRYPILDEEMVTLEGRRAHLVATLDVDGERLSLTVVHLSLAASLFGRVEGSVRDLDRLVPPLLSNPPGLLVGDFNSAETSATYAGLRRAGLVDTFREAGRGFGFTFPLPGRYRGLPLPPFVRIDHVWRTPGLVATRAGTGEDGGSDHLPLLVELRFQP